MKRPVFSATIFCALACTQAIAASVKKEEEKGIKCEWVGSYNTYSDACCYMKGKTIINESSMELAKRNETYIDALNFNMNKKIQFLPIRVSETFPHIVQYLANRCSIKIISKSNFEGLTEMTDILLGGNQIEVVPTDTFEGLVNLVYLDFYQNRITQMSGKMIESLPALAFLDLDGNICIDANFVDQEKIRNHVADLITKSCDPEKP